MKNKITLLLLIASTTAVFSQITNSAPYCASQYQTNYNMISAMSFNGTSFTGFGATGSWTSPNTYKYFNTTALNPITLGQSFTLSITFPSVNDQEPRYFAVWIDFNKNNTFENSERIMYNSNTIQAQLPVFGAASAQPSINIQVPLTAQTGVTRMRIIRGQNNMNLYGPYDNSFILSEPCINVNQFAYGCVYDFNVTILGNLNTLQVDKPNLFTVFPVPADNVLYLEKKSLEKIKRIQICDLSGRAVYSQNSEIESINISELISGSYILFVELENNDLYANKFIKK